MNRYDVCSTLVIASCLAGLSGCAVEIEEGNENDVLQESSSELEYNPGSGWNLAWSDEFEGSSLNGANWNVLTSNWDPVTNNCNFGTGELEYPRAQNVTVGGGKLALAVQRANDSPNDPKCAGYGPRSFYGGRIHTKGKVEKKYGRIVASIKVPSGFGMWPAFWTLGANISGATPWPNCGEIDILEWKSTEPSWMKSAMHWFNGGQADWGTGANRGYSLADAFHTYEVEWSASTVIFRLDGNIVANAPFNHNETEFQQNHYILLNMAIGGNWYGDPSPASIDLPSGVTKTMEVEWVRWYQQGAVQPPPTGGGSVGITNSGFESGATGWSTWSPNGTGNAAVVETYNGGHSGAYHLTHWANNTPFEAWTYQSKSGLASGNYKVRAWVRKSGAFNISRLQVKTSAGGAPAYTDLGTYGNWTLVETPAISVSGGYVEFGFHTQLNPGNGANFIHMDDVELIKL